MEAQRQYKKYRFRETAAKGENKMIYLKVTGVAMISLSFGYALDMSLANHALLQVGMMLMLLPKNIKGE